MDPLETFRAAVSTKYDIKPVNASGVPASSLRSATHLRLSTAVTFPINTPTRLRKVGSSAPDPTSEPDGFFMLDAVYLAWSLRDTPGGEYMKQAREHGFPAGGFVGLTERKSIVDWLKRAVTVLDSIVPLSGMFLFIFESPSVPFQPERTQSRQLPRDLLPPLFIASFPPHPLLFPTRKHYPPHPPAPVETPGQPHHLPRDVTYPTLLT
jgi:parafibromin